jgi:hypothetical protein
MGDSVEHRCSGVRLESQVFGPEVLRDAEKQVQMIRENLKVAQSWQKSYADKRRDLSFEVGDFVYLKASPMRGTHRFKVKGKLAPRYVRPFKIVDRKGEVAYQLELPPQLSDVHDVLHVSQHKKCLRVPEEQLPMEELDLGDDLTYSERLIKILDIAERVNRNKVASSSIESPYRRWSYLGAWRRAPSRLSWIIPERFLNLKGEIPLRG